MIRYLIPFLTAFLLTVILMIPAIVLGRKLKWTKRKSNRHTHKKGAIRIGGIAAVLAFIISILVNKDLFITVELYGVMAASLVLTVAGIWDDLKEIFWKMQLFFQLSAATLIFIIGIRIYYITNPINGGIINLDSGWSVLISVILVIFWIVLVMNSINWLDGVDGLAGGVTLIASLTIFILSLRGEVNQPPVAIVSIIFAGTLLGFLIFNFSPAKVLAGTSGAMFMGFILATLAIIAGTKIATALLVMAVPIIDLLWVIRERIKSRQSIFEPDTKHLHFKLLELGWSPKKIALTYYFITALIAVIALNTRVIGKSITLILAAVVMFFVYFAISRKVSSEYSLK